MKIKHCHIATINSTSLYLKENFDNADNFSFVSTAFQFEGKGRGDRTWVSPIGENLLFSFLIKDESLIEKYKEISIATSYVIAKYIEEHYDVKPSIKWPNDVYVNDKKIAGILLETHMSEDNIDGLIVGVGFNINQILFPNDFIHPATSLKLLTQKDEDIDKIRDELFIRIVSYLLKLKNGNNDFYSYALQNNYLQDKTCYAEVNGKEEKVEVITINRDCSLRVKLNNEFYDLVSGEIHFSKIEL